MNRRCGWIWIRREKVVFFVFFFFWFVLLFVSIGFVLVVVGFIIPRERERESLKEDERKGRIRFVFLHLPVYGKAEDRERGMVVSPDWHV